MPARMRPMHMGHHHLLDLLLSRGYVTLVICWANVLDYESPLFAFETRAMVNACFSDHPNLRILQMPRYPVDDDEAFIGHLRELAIDTISPRLVSNNPNVIRASERYFPEMEIVNPHSIVDTRYRNIQGTDVRELIRQQDDTFHMYIPECAGRILERVNRIDRIRAFAEKRLSFDLQSQCRIQLLGMSRPVILPFPSNDIFIDDYIVSYLYEHGYYEVDQSESLGTLHTLGVAYADNIREIILRFEVSGRLYHRDI